MLYNLPLPSLSRSRVAFILGFTLDSALTCNFLKSLLIILVFSKVSLLWLVRAPIFPCSLCAASWSFNLYMHKLLLWRSLYRFLELFLHPSPLLFDTLPSTFCLLHPYWNMFSYLLNSVTLPHSTLPPCPEN